MTSPRRRVCERAHTFASSRGTANLSQGRPIQRPRPTGQGVGFKLVWELVWSWFGAGLAAGFELVWQLVWSWFGSWFGAGLELVWQLVWSWLAAGSGAGLELHLGQQFLGSLAVLGDLSRARRRRLAINNQTGEFLFLLGFCISAFWQSTQTYLPLINTLAQATHQPII